MGKLDASTGLSTEEITAIKFMVKRKIALQLPELPDLIEMQLFYNARSAWMFTWNVLNKDVYSSKLSIVEIN